MPSPRAAWLLALVAVAIAALPGCGGSEGPDTGAGPPSSQATGDQPFPSVRGKTMAELVGGLPEGPVLAPAVSILGRGANRFGFALFDRARKQLTGAPAAIYTASMNGDGLRGPYQARSESLWVPVAYRSKTTTRNPDVAKAVYVSDVPFRRDGPQRVIALARLDGRLVATSSFSVDVGAHRQPPRVGERAVRVHTPTVASVGGDVASIDTRNPPASSLHAVDLWSVMGRKPVVLVFATPSLCRTRVCGPVVDIAAELQERYGPRVEFIHMEIYKDNRAAEGLRPQAQAWRLPSEPWTFVIDRRGRIAARFESAFSAAELARAIDRVLERS